MSQRQLDKFDNDNERAYDAFTELVKGLRERGMDISDPVYHIIPSKSTDFPLREIIRNLPDDEKHP